MKQIINENVIGTYSSKNVLEHYKKIGLWKSEEILIEKYFKKKNAKILDIGCGGGRTTIPLVKMKYNVTAFDITPAMIKLTKENLRKNKIQAKVEVRDATKMRYSLNYFDYAIFSFNGIEAIPGKQNRINAFKETYRVLKSKGIFIFTTNTKKYFKGKIKFFFLREAIKYYISKIFAIKNKYSRIDDFEYGDCFLNFKPPMFIHFSTPKKIKKYLKRVGFRLIYSNFRDIIEKKKNPNLKKDYFYVCEKV